MNIAKKCSGPCGRTLALEDFRKDPTKTSGRKSRCKQCLSRKQSVASNKWPSINAFDKAEGRGTFDGTVADPYTIKSRSTQYDRNGQILSEWVKTDKAKEDEYKALMDACAHLADKWPERAKATKAPKYLNDDLLCVYPMGDPHLGLLAWPAETGNKFDLVIAERNLFDAADKLVALAPPAKHGLVVNLGDFFHSDNHKGETTHGTKVDVDGRWPKVLQTGVRLMRRIIERALEKHDHVTVINEIGNHDSHSAIMLAICLAQFYENEPRVTVDASPEPFHYYRFGSVFIGVTHGDKTKKPDLGPIMATDRPKDWGETKHRYWYIGHVHHDTVKELHGVTVESFRTLAGKDAWHHGKGYRAGRDMKMDVIHKDYGRINRHIIGIDQLDFS